MALLSSNVLTNDAVVAAQYNNLRYDLLHHTHDGADTAITGLVNNAFLTAQNVALVTKNLIGRNNANEVVVGDATQAGSLALVGGDTSSYVRILLGAIEAGRWITSGGVGLLGINTTAPSQALDVVGSAKASVSFIGPTIGPSATQQHTLPAVASDTFVLRTATQTLTNKTLTTPIISSISNTGTLTLPTSTDTLVGRATTDTLTNKTLTSPALGGTVTGTPAWASTQAMNISGNAATATSATSATSASSATTAGSVNAANLTGGTLASGVTASSLQSFGLVSLTNYIRVSAGALISATDHVTVPRTGGNYNQIFNKIAGTGSFLFRKVTNVEDVTTGATNLLAIDDDGNLIATGSYLGSDESLKTNFRPLTVGVERTIDKLARIKPRRYDRVDLGGRSEIGVTAQQVEAEFPEFVREFNHMPGHPPEEGKTYKAVDYARLVVPLMAAVQELRDELQALQRAA